MNDDFTTVNFMMTQPIDGLEMIRVVEKELFLIKPDKIEFSSNEVRAVYGNYEQIITAEGSENERHNFKSEIRKYSGG